MTTSTKDDFRFARSGDIDLCYESFGDPGDPPLLLVMGLGTSMIGWDTAFCGRLADRGFHVVRFDNRDTGMSGRVDWAVPSRLEFVKTALAGREGRPVESAYTLSDMAGDAVAVLDAVGGERAHVAGASLGGMIAQTVAIEHPERVLSLCTMMSTTGDRDVGMPGRKAIRMLLRRPASGREATIARIMATMRLIGSPGMYDPDRARALARQAYAHGFSVPGRTRQILAILASGSRSEALAKLDVPAVVIHGDADPMVDVSGGRRTAEVIPDAHLVEIHGMGHDLQPVFWPRIVDAIAANAARSQPATTAAGPPVATGI